MIKCSCGYRIGHPSFPECICNKTSGWQYLTDDDIKEILGTYSKDLGPYVRELFDKIQAKIKEKNENV